MFDDIGKCRSNLLGDGGWVFVAKVKPGTFFGRNGCCKADIDSRDFFAVTHFPLALYKSTSVEGDRGGIYSLPC